MYVHVGYKCVTQMCGRSSHCLNAQERRRFPNGAWFMDDSHTSLSEDTHASLDAIVVHESEEYFLVEITTPRVRTLLDSRDGFLERLLLLTPAEADSDAMCALREDKAPSDITSEMTMLERSSYVEACAMEASRTLAMNAFTERPSTNTWHPESSSRELSTDEFVRASRRSDRARQLLEERVQQKS